MSDVRTTALHDWHRELGARMVSFAGWSMPIQYPTGIIAEHRACRERAALFDVSHMGTVHIPGDVDAAAAALERVLCGDLKGQRLGTAKYTLLLTDEGGVVDDLMATRHDDGWYLVLNASRTEADLEVLAAALPAAHQPVLLANRALLALQGPLAAEILAVYISESAPMRFRESRQVTIGGAPARISRLGYTGEDGFEIELAADQAVGFAQQLTSDARVTPAGLGARDSLRLEAGLCLYGHELDTMTSPVAAGLGWAINKRRRQDGGFPGADRLLRELREGAPERLVGLMLEGRMPAREGALVEHGGRVVGRVTSGGFGPTVEAPIAMAYVEAPLAEPATALCCKVRQHEIQARVTAMPFVAPNYHR